MSTGSIACPRCGNTEFVALYGPAYAPSQQPCFTCGNCGHRFADGSPAAFEESERSKAASVAAADAYRGRMGR